VELRLIEERITCGDEAEDGSYLWTRVPHTRGPAARGEP
jgi:hypothetical protein